MNKMERIDDVDMNESHTCSKFWWAPHHRTLLQRTLLLFFSSLSLTRSMCRFFNVFFFLIDSTRVCVYLLIYNLHKMMTDSQLKLGWHKANSIWILYESIKEIPYKNTRTHTHHTPSVTLKSVNNCLNGPCLCYFFFCWCWCWCCFIFEWITFAHFS